MAKPSRSRSSSRAASNGILDDLLWSSARLFRKFLHGLLCLVALVLGFRLSGEAVLFLGTSSKGALFLKRSSSDLHAEGNDVALKFPYITETTASVSKPTVTFHSSGDPLLHNVDPSETIGSLAKQQPSSPETKNNRVHVGRHEIPIRLQPHPDPLQSIKAHNLLRLVQHEQMSLYDSNEHQQLLVVTPTFVRTFQALHLTCLIHTLRIVPFPLIWIVIEAGGLSHETAALLSTSQISFHHVGLQEAMPRSWAQHHELEKRLRTEGLRFIREMQLDGIVLFLDDSNTYSLEFFKEAQKTKWIGGFSVGLLSEWTVTKSAEETLVDANEESSSSRLSALQLQGPVCDSSRHSVGWFPPFEVVNGPDTLDQRALEWTGFTLNAKLLWEGYEMPAGFRSWNEVFKQNTSVIQSPLEFAWNSSLVEPLGDCGHNILLWWLRTEARADSKFPSRWEINPRLEIVVPSKRTPWPDLPLRKHYIRLPVTMASSEKHRINQSNKVRRTRKNPV